MLKSENEPLSIESRVEESTEFECTGLKRATSIAQKRMKKNILEPEISAKELGISKGLEKNQAASP